jgi:hypothetical protein
MAEQRHVVGVEWMTDSPSPTLLEGYMQEGPAMIEQLNVLTARAAAFARKSGGQILPESLQIAVRVEGGVAINRATVVVVASTG